MKHKIISFLILIISFSTYSQNEKIIGKWINTEDKNPVNAFDFNANNTAIMYNNNLPSPIFKLKIDSSKNPIWLDMSIEKEGVLVELYGLLEFIDEKTIRLKIYRGDYEKHPESFSERSKTAVVFILKRGKIIFK
jgi:hypothetical protein